MKNPYLKNLNKIEFVVTNACTGHCKHCSQGAHNAPIERIDPTLAAQAAKKITDVYDIKTVMTFGGEPLLHTDAVFAIMRAAKEQNVPRRQLITNGYFTKDAARMRDVAKELAACGVNDLLLSVDAFHAETIPLDAVKCFATEVIACGIPARLSPAWLVSEADDNAYNQKTREILAHFTAMGMPESAGNVVFPEGNAVKYLAAYFNDARPANPYEEDPRDVRCVSFAPNGDVLHGNVYKQDVLQILKEYTPL